MSSHIRPSRPTASTRAEWEEWLSRWRWDRFVTLAFNNAGIGQPVRGPDDNRLFILRDKLKEWDGRMQRNVVGSNWAAMPDYRLFCIYTLEKPTANPHWHGLVMFFNVDDAERARQAERFDKTADLTWRKLVPSGDVVVKEVYDDNGAIGYVGKSILSQLNFEYWVPPDEFVGR